MSNPDTLECRPMSDNVVRARADDRAGASGASARRGGGALMAPQPTAVAADPQQIAETFAKGERVEVIKAWRQLGGAEPAGEMPVWSPAVVVRINRARRSVIVRRDGETQTRGVPLADVRRPDAPPAWTAAAWHREEIEVAGIMAPPVKVGRCKVQTMVDEPTRAAIVALAEREGITWGAAVRLLLQAGIDKLTATKGRH